MPSISDKICNILDLLKTKTENSNKEELKDNLLKDELIELDNLPDSSSLEAYITCSNIINYEKLLHDEILNFDKVLTQRLSQAALFSGTTCNILVVDLKNKIIVCCNVGGIY
jgi:hypothetical protein